MYTPRVLESTDADVGAILALAARLTGCAVLAHPEVLTVSDHSPVWAQFEV